MNSNQEQPPEVFYKKHLCQGLFLNKVAGLGTATLLKKKLWHSCFPVNFAKLLRTPILKNICKRLLMSLSRQFCYLSIIYAVCHLYFKDWLLRQQILCKFSSCLLCEDLTENCLKLSVTETFTFSKSTIETLENVVKYIQS